MNENEKKQRAKIAMHKLHVLLAYDEIKRTTATCNNSNRIRYSEFPNYCKC